MSDPALSLAIPCYDEEACIEATARDLLRVFAEREVAVELVLVDNGSTDRTGAILADLARTEPRVIHRTVEVNQGYGHGVLTGLAACRGRHVGFLCADGQVEAADVARLYELALERPDALVKVRRRFRQDGLRRKLVSVAYNGLAAALWGGLGSIDLNGNPKIFPKAWLAELALSSRDWFLDPELMIKARARRWPVVEIDVRARRRQGGRSHVGASTTVEFALNLLRYRLRGEEQGR